MQLLNRQHEHEYVDRLRTGDEFQEDGPADECRPGCHAGQHQQEDSTVSTVPEQEAWPWTHEQRGQRLEGRLRDLPGEAEQEAESKRGRLEQALRQSQKQRLERHQEIPQQSKIE